MDSPAPSPAGECAPHFWFREEGGGVHAHSLAGKGVGESQFRRGDIHCGTLGTGILYVYCLCTLWCTWISLFSVLLQRLIRRIITFFFSFAISWVFSFFCKRVQSCHIARIYRPSFGHENDRFGEKQLKTLVFNPICTQRRWYQLVLDKIIGG